MLSSYSVFQEAQVVCGKCHKPFPFKLPMVINAVTDPDHVEQLKDLSLLLASCEHCGNTAPAPAIFLYYNPAQSILWAVSTESYEIRFQQLRNIVTNISSEYMKLLPTEDAERFNLLSWQLIRLPTFLQKIGSPLAEGHGRGFIHFYPIPKVVIDSKLAHDFVDVPAVQVKQFDAGLVEGNYPDFYDSLWELLNNEFQYRRQYLHTEKITEPKRPISTLGYPELLIYIGSNIVVPILVGALANLISDLILEKRKAKQKLELSLEKAKQVNHSQILVLEEKIKKINKLQDHEMLPSDEVRVRLRVLEDKKEYIFHGSIREVCKELKKFRKDILHSVHIPGDCHIANFAGDHYMDATINATGKTEEIKKRFGKIFRNSTRVRFAEGEQGEYISATTMICGQARALMAKEKYGEAVELLQKQLRGDETTIEVLYNYALSLDELGYDEEANFFYEQVLVRAINLPSLEDTAKIITGIPIKK